MSIMRALCISKAGLSLVDIPLPSPGDDEVIIKVKFAGICGSDIKMIMGEMSHDDGAILGHEFSGVIAAKGKNTTKFKLGERVIADPTITCSKCDFCLSDKRNLCTNLNGREGGELGVNINGAFAEYVRIREDNVYHIPKGISFERAVLSEPLACVLNGFNRLCVQPKTKACVIGLGPTGVLWAQTMKIHGVRVSGIETSVYRRKIASSIGIKQSKDDGDFDYVIDTTGVNFFEACKLVKPGGKVVLFGMSPEHTEDVSPYLIAKKNIDVHGVNIDSATFPQALEVLGKIKSENLITNIFPLEDYHNAFDLAGLDINLKKLHPAKAMKVLFCL